MKSHGIGAGVGDGGSSSGGDKSDSSLSRAPGGDAAHGLRAANKLNLPWQRNPLFRFFSSVRLAMLLLAVIIVASIVGTIFESSFDARVARTYVYGAPWFNLWLLLLAINLAAAAFSRMPWKRHHTGFLITHLGIIIVLAGSLIGRTWGIEGTVTLFKGQPPISHLVLDERVLQVVENRGGSTAATATSGGLQVVPLEVIRRQPTPERPWRMLTTASGWQIEAVDYSKSLGVKMEPQSLTEGDHRGHDHGPNHGAPALHVSLATAMMGQKLEAWLLADDPTHGTFDLGLASISLKKGIAPGVPNAASGSASSATAAAAAAAEPVEIEEAIFAFANSSAGQVSKALQGGSTGAKITLRGVVKGGSGTLIVEIGERSESFEVAAHLGKSTPVPNSPFTLSIDQYWPDFRIQEGRPVSVSDEPNNPCVLVTLRGRAVPVAEPPEPAVAGAAASAGRNQLVLYVDENGGLTYELRARQDTTPKSGRLELHQPLPTGWADWQLNAERYLPKAEEHFVARPIDPAAGMTAAPLPGMPGAASAAPTEGVLIRATGAGKKPVEQWVPLGWQISLPTQPGPLRIGYGFRRQPLPISLQLLDFEVERNEGTDSPAGFRSTLAITDMAGRATTGQCWMNHPISYPGSWLNTFSGLTYKISQASWNPENLSQSTVQILRDPGWGLKWIGSLMVCAGIFCLFYLRPYPADVRREGIVAPQKPQAALPRQKAAPREPVEVP